MCTAQRRKGMEGDVVPERDLSLSMAIQSHEAQSKRGTLRACHEGQLALCCTFHSLAFLSSRRCGASCMFSSLANEE